MKKIASLFAILFLIASPAFAAVSITPAPPQPTGTDLVFNITDGTGHLFFFDLSDGTQLWDNRNTAFPDGDKAVSTFGIDFIGRPSPYTFGVGNYRLLYTADGGASHNCFATTNLSDCTDALTPTSGFGSYDFDIVAPPPPPPAAPFFSVSTTTAPNTIGTVSAAFRDPGALSVIALAAGIPLAFWFIARLISLASVGSATKPPRR